jgi:hypothetical protein
MVTAALKFAFDKEAPCTYPTQDEARLAVLNTLNWYEAHREYTWPNFTSLGFDFGQAMRFRRALVSDVCVALQKAGNIKMSNGRGLRGTPNSEGDRGGEKRGIGA